MDPTQILLFSVVTILTLLLVAVGVQVFFILREAKKALERVNRILEPISGLASFVEGIKSIRELIDFVSERNHQEGGQIEAPEAHSHIEELQERGRRFFHKDGKPLTS